MNNHVVVPAEPFRRIIRQRALEVSTDNELRGEGIGIVSDELGVDPGRVYRILNEQDSIAFDTADRIVSRFLGPFAWLQDPELNEIYESVNLRRLDWTYPTSEVVREKLTRVAVEAHAVHGSGRKVARALGVPEGAVKRLLREAA